MWTLRGSPSLRGRLLHAVPTLFLFLLPAVTVLCLSEVLRSCQRKPSSYCVHLVTPGQCLCALVGMQFTKGCLLCSFSSFSFCACLSPSGLDMFAVCVAFLCRYLLIASSSFFILFLSLPNPPPPPSSTPSLSLSLSLLCLSRRAV